MTTRYKPGRMSTFVFDEETLARHDARVKAEALREVARVQLDPEGWRCIDHQGLMQEADRLEAEAEGKL